MMDMHAINDEDAMPHFGPCCNCGRNEGVRNIVMISRRGPARGCGWGCVVCRLPLDGAIAVVCDDCIDVSPPRFVCAGYPVTLERVAFDALSPEPFDHDPTKHPDKDDG